MLARNPLLAALATLALALAACGDARQVQEGSGGGACTSCHGDANRVAALQGTDANLAAAPPRAPTGAPTQVVGAHQAHLNPPATGSLRGPIACSECHQVPQNANHATNPPAEKVQFGTLATTGGAQPTWNGVNTPTGINTPTCSNVYCHGNFTFNGVSGNGGNQPDWTVSGQPACTTCHAMPPAGHLPLGGTVTAATCNDCHSATVDSSGRIIIAADGSSHHVNGQIDERAHTDPSWLTASGGNHTSAALNQSPPFASCLTCHTNLGAADPNNDAGSSCNTCHATALATATTPEGRDWLQNCVFCHGDKSKLLAYAVTDKTTDPWIIAPPTGARGEAATTSLAVGAHQRHVSLTGNALSNPFACSECHTPSLPLAVQWTPPLSQTTHLTADGSVPVLLAGALATHGGVQGTFTAPSCAATYCHGNYTFTFGTGTPAVSGNNATPIWNQVDGTFAACTSCHGAPPDTGRHVFHVRDLLLDCSACHNGVASGSGAAVPVTNGTIVGPSFHVNGSVDVVLDPVLSPGKSWNGQNWSVGCSFAAASCH